MSSTAVSSDTNLAVAERKSKRFGRGRGRDADVLRVTIRRVTSSDGIRERYHFHSEIAFARCSGKLAKANIRNTNRRIVLRFISTVFVYRQGTCLNLRKTNAD